MARSPVWKCGCMLTPLVTTYRVEPPMLLGAKKCHATATSATSAPVSTRERGRSRFFTVGGHCCLPYKCVWESATRSRSPLRSAHCGCLRAVVIGQGARTAARAHDSQREGVSAAGGLATALVVGRVEVAGHDSVAASVDGTG